MKLYYIPGACSLASHIMLNEIGEKFTIESIDAETKITASGENFNEINPKGYVPVLRLENNETLTEGAAIIQYLADKHPELKLAPRQGTLERARFHEHLTYISSELHKAFAPFYSSIATNETKQAARETVKNKLDVFETLFSDGRKYLLGDMFTAIDAYLFVVTSWAVPNDISLDKWSGINAFCDRMANRESVKNAMRAEGLVQ